MAEASNQSTGRMPPTLAFPQQQSAGKQSVPLNIVRGSTGGLTEVKTERTQQSVHDADATKATHHDDIQKMAGLNLAEFLNQLEDYTPTASSFICWQIVLTLRPKNMST